jgi:hypothetical protein
MTEPEQDPGWRVRMGGGLLANQPMSAEWRAQQAREDEREAKQAALEAELRQQAALEHRRSLEMQGVVPRTPFEVMEAAHAWRDRQVERDERQRIQNEPARQAAQHRSQAAQLRDARARADRAEARHAEAVRQANAAHAARHRAEEETQAYRDTAYRSNYYYR